MSGKTAKQIRRTLGKVQRNEEEIADNLVRQLLESPFKIRFLFAMQLIFFRKKRNKKNG